MTLRVPPVSFRSIRVALVQVHRPILEPRCSRIWPEGRWAKEDCGYQASCSVLHRRVPTQTGGHAASPAARRGQWPSRRFDSVGPLFPGQGKGMPNGQRPMCGPEGASAAGASHVGCFVHGASTALPVLLKVGCQRTGGLTLRRGTDQARALARNNCDCWPRGTLVDGGARRVVQPSHRRGATL